MRAVAAPEHRNLLYAWCDLFMSRNQPIHYDRQYFLLT